MLDTTDIDLYAILDISAAAEAETVRRVVSLLLARYGPGNPLTEDARTFQLVKSAGEILTDPKRRVKYDAARSKCRAPALDVFARPEYTIGLEGEHNRRSGILTLLYSHRRLNPDHPDVSLLQLETWMVLPREHLMFAVWYLRSRGFIAEVESNNLAITADGVDNLESQLRERPLLYRLIWPLEEGATASEPAPDTPNHVDQRE